MAWGTFEPACLHKRIGPTGAAACHLRTCLRMSPDCIMVSRITVSLSRQEENGTAVLIVQHYLQCCCDNKDSCSVLLKHCVLSYFMTQLVSSRRLEAACSRPQVRRSSLCALAHMASLNNHVTLEAPVYKPHWHHSLCACRRQR
jgi:hypothetical protein